MKVVILGGIEQISCQYADICKNHGCTAKIFIKEHAMKGKLGNPDLLILFTSTVSHSMVNGVMKEAKRNNIPIARVRSSSVSALNQALCAHCGASMP